MYNILLIGDSLTDLGYHNGWGYYMRIWYKDKANVINKAICKYTSHMIKNLFTDLIDKTTIHLCTILLGTNDCYNPDLFVDPLQYKENILFMIDNVRQHNPTCLILLITPPICKFHFGILEYVEKIYQIIGERKHITLIDLHHGFNTIEISDLDPDGLHLNSLGNWKVYGKIKMAIENHLTFISPNSL